MNSQSGSQTILWSFLMLRINYCRKKSMVARDNSVTMTTWHQQDRPQQAPSGDNGDYYQKRWGFRYGNQGSASRKTVLPDTEISITKIRYSWNHLIFIISLLYIGNTYLYWISPQNSTSPGFQSVKMYLIDTNTKTRNAEFLQVKFSDAFSWKENNCILITNGAGIPLTSTLSENPQVSLRCCQPEVTIPIQPGDPRGSQ